MLREDLRRVPPEHRFDRLGPGARQLVPFVSDLLPGHQLAASAPARVHDSDIDVGRYQVLEAFTAWLADRAGRAPTYLVIDDLQWADTETLDLLAHLQAAALPGVLLLLAMRDREHPVEERRRRGLDAFLTEASGRQLHLVGLPADDAAALVEYEARQHDGDGVVTLPDEVVATMVDLAGGHPLYLLELARHWLQHRSSALPDGVLAAVSQRLQSLAPGVRLTLIDAALVGPTFDQETLTAVSHTDAGGVAATLEQAAYARVIEPVPGRTQSFRFTHDLLRVALTRDLPARRIAQRRGRIAQAWDRHRTAESSIGVAELGRHFAAAMADGTDARAATYLLQAGDQATKQHAPFVALGFYQEALGLVRTDEPSALAVDLHHGLGVAQLRTGDPRYRATLLEAARLAGELGDLPRMTSAVLANNRGWYSSLTEVDEERIRTIEAVLEAGAPDGPSHALLLAAWAVESIRDPARRGAALARSEEALRRGEDLQDRHLLAKLITSHYTVTHSAFVDPQLSVDLSRRLLALAEKLTDPGWRLSGLVERAQSHFLSGDRAAVDESLPEAIALARSLKAPARHWMLLCWQAMSTLLDGKLEAAEHEIGEALELGVAIGQPDAMDWYAGQFFLLRWMGGRLDEIIVEVEEQADLLSARLPVWRAGQAMARAETGNLTGANALLDAGLASSHWHPPDLLWLPGMCFWSRAAVRTGHREAAARLYSGLLPYAGLVAHNGTIDGGPVDVHLTHLAELLEDTEATERHRRDAKQWCHGANAPLWARQV
jgi:hypothetical protein